MCGGFPACLNYAGDGQRVKGCWGLPWGGGRVHTCAVPYTNPAIIADTRWLAEHLRDPRVVVVDCDELPAYQRVHIEGAVTLRSHHYLKEKGDSASGPGIGVHVMPPEEFEEEMGRIGVSNDKTVVTYDSFGGLYAARLWWVLDYYGHSDCKVLNGGFRSWFLEGRPVSLERPRIEPAKFEVRATRHDICATRAEVNSAIGRNDTVIWDVRAHAEYTGEDPRVNKRAGHIPGAVNLEWLELQEPPVRSGLLLPEEKIREKLEAIGVTPDKHVITHCQAGIRAAQAYFVLRLLGYPSAANYDGSWSDWGNRDDTQVVQGEGG